MIIQIITPESDFDFTFMNAKGKLIFRSSGISTYNQYYQEKYFPILQYDDSQNCNLQNLMMLVLEDLHTIISIHFFLLRIINEENSSSLPLSATLPSCMDCNDGRS